MAHDGHPVDPCLSQEKVRGSRKHVPHPQRRSLDQVSDFGGLWSGTDYDDSHGNGVAVESAPTAA